MKAFIPAAGLGTRLGHLTKDQPKALTRVNGTPMLELTIERLKKKGITQFMVNIHHHGQRNTASDPLVSWLGQVADG